MEKIGKLTAGHQRIFAGVDDFLELSLSLVVLLGKQQSLAGQCLGEALGDAISTKLVRRTLALCQVGLCFLALFGDPLEILLLGHLAVGRQVVGIEQVVDKRRLSPVTRQQEEVVSPEHACLCNGLFLIGRRRFLELLDDEVVAVHREIETLVVIVNGFGIAQVAELVDGTAKLMVAIVATTVEHVVARVVGQHSRRRVDARTAAYRGTSQRVDHKALVS